ncbi:MAG: kelch repeat-containing protein [Kofleriaceae bacterium]
MRALLCVVTLAICASCVRPESVRCPDGSVCPRDRTCWLLQETYQCVSDDQIAACDGKADFTACPSGTCLGGVCLTPSCGDGRVGPIEVCDDGNTTGGDGCSSDCVSDETCGNGIIDLQVGEECDDGASFAGLSHDGCSSGCREERPSWRTLANYEALFTPDPEWRVVYDSRRGRVVAVALNRATIKTLELDNGVWTDVSPLVSPTGRVGFGLAYDAHRQRTVLFGGAGFRDTWEWDGATWTLLAPATMPSPRSGMAMTYDPIGRRVVMFGGRAGVLGMNTEIADTWIWDGTSWAQIAGPGPSPRADAVTSFDPVRGVIVLYGGWSDANVLLSDTWELSGSTWVERTSLVTPGPRRQPTMAFDPESARLLLTSGSVMGSTYAWNGDQWAQVSSSLSTAGAQMVTLAHERRVLLVANLGMYAWNGSDWTQLFVAVQGGFSRMASAAAVDPFGRRILVAGGAPTSSTVMWRGAWMRVVGPEVSGRQNAAMAYDVRRDEFVLFGGSSGPSDLDETWVYTAAGWTRRFPTLAPLARLGHAMVYDAGRGVVVMFGGLSGGAQRADSWTWDGSTWTEIAGVGPSARMFHAAAYDPIRGEMIIFGGLGPNGTPLGDTWAWNGAWTKKSDLGPSPRFSTGIAWDAARRRIVLFGGNNTAANFNDVWEWDGTTWTQVATSPIAPRSGHILVSALDGAGVLRFGSSSPQSFDEVVQLRWAAEESEEACIIGGNFDGDRWTEPGCGGGDPDCWRICSPACPPGTSCAMDAARCGDGACSVERENCLTCPVDCGECLVTCGDFSCEAGETQTTCMGDCL